jgi:hypothetical protein
MKLSWNASQPDKSLPPSLSGVQVVSPLTQWNNQSNQAASSPLPPLYTIHDNESNRESSSSQGPVQCLDFGQNQRESTQEEKVGIFDLETAGDK